MSEDRSTMLGLRNNNQSMRVGGGLSVGKVGHRVDESTPASRMHSSFNQKECRQGG